MAAIRLQKRSSPVRAETFSPSGGKGGRLHVRSTWSAGERSEGEAPKAGADPFPRAARERSLPQMVSVSRLLWGYPCGASSRRL
jgi:hypothetical protein